ncbi:hypothetical protein Tco_0815006, partial [Tanacetum coccineum]
GSLVLGFPSISLIVVVARVGPLPGKDLRSIMIADADSPSADDLRRRPKPARVRLAMPGPCQCVPGLSLGPVICIVGPKAHCGSKAQTQRPSMPIMRHQVPSLVGSLLAVL